MPGPLTVTRLLQNPLGDHAPEGERGDIVQVSDGAATIYLTPGEYDQASSAHLRYLLAARELRRRTSWPACVQAAVAKQGCDGDL